MTTPDAADWKTRFDSGRRLLKEDQSVDSYLTDLLGRDYALYRTAWAQAGQAPLSVPAFPLQLDFQLNNRCNFRCPMCYWSDPKSLEDSSRPAEEFPLPKFAEIVRDGVGRGLRAINFEGLNEPLLKKDLADYIRLAKKAGVVDLTLHTNGWLLSPEWSKRLIDSGLTKLMVSLDAFSPETFKHTRASDHYDKVVGNIAEFLNIRFKQRAPLPLLRTSFVVQPANKHEKSAFEAFWTRYADWVQIQELMDMTNLVAEKGDYTAPSGPKVCPQPFYRMSVKTNGEVFPCCCSLGHKFLAKGNVHDDSAATLWRSDHFENIRRLHAEGRYREIEACRICLDNVFQ